MRIGLGRNGMRDLVGVGDADCDGHLDLGAVRRSTSQLFVYEGSVLRAHVAGTGFTAGRGPVL